MIQAMLEKATMAMRNAYNPYSNFFVGCCIHAKNGKLYAGCNIENVSYSLTLCAEAAALSAMVTDGAREIDEVVIVADCDKIIAPCGACRQRFREFTQADVKFHLFNNQGESKVMTMAELLPFSFDAEHLETAK